MKSSQALFGGTFNPMHYGHLKPVETLANLVGLTRATIIPSGVPPYRLQLEANDVQHKHILELTTAGKPLFTLGERELKRNAPSYTAQALKEWQQERGSDVLLTSVIGQDSLLTFPTWYEYETVLDNAYLIVYRRSGYPLKAAQPRYQQWLKDHLAHNPEDPHLQPTGKIHLIETPWFDAPATIVHERLQDGESCGDLLPEPILAYVGRQGLYH